MFQFLICVCVCKNKMLIYMKNYSFVIERNIFVCIRDVGFRGSYYFIYFAQLVKIFVVFIKGYLILKFDFSYQKILEFISGIEYQSWYELE